MKSNLPTWLLHLFFWSGALLYGLFYEVLFMVATIYLLLGWLVILWMAMRSADEVLRLQPVHLLVILYVSIYWISVLFALDREQAIFEASRVTLLVPLVLTVTLLTFQQQIQLIKSWVWLGAFLVVWGLAFGLVRDGRLESTFGYANALAIFLLVNVIMGLLVYMKSPRLLELMLLLINFVGLTLTLSRAVWVIACMMFIVMIVWVPKMRSKRWIRSLAPAAVGIAVFLWVRGEWSALADRLMSIQWKSSEFQLRLSYWQDAWSIIRDNGWLGSGGGGWRLLQPDWYYSKYVHHHYLQILLDTGWMGLVIFFSLSGYFYYRCIPNINILGGDHRNWSKAILLAVTAILLHAAFDLDLVFPLLFAVLVALIAVVEKEKAGWEIRLSGSRLVTASMAVVMVVGLFGWMAVGYGFQWKGIQQVQQGQLEQGMSHLRTAGWMIPWSNTNDFEMAKGYILLGQRDGKTIYYEMAEMKLDQALLRVPENKVYRRMKQEFHTTK